MVKKIKSLIMGKEINLLKNYPASKRNISERANFKTEEVRKIARQFGREFFDGDRMYGYGGFNYNAKYWKPVVPTLKEYWNLNSKSSMLDVGCAKGFMLYEISKFIPKIDIKGVDISKYAIEHSHPEMQKNLQIASADNLPFPDNSFDVVISINTIHNLDKDGCRLALKEIERVSKSNAFITVDAFRNEEEEKNMVDWNLTAKTIMSVEEWKVFFDESGYSGDYYWFIP